MQIEWINEYEKWRGKWSDNAVKKIERKEIRNLWVRKSENLGENSRVWFKIVSISTFWDKSEKMSLVKRKSENRKAKGRAKRKRKDLHRRKGKYWDAIWSAVKWKLNKRKRKGKAVNLEKFLESKRDK